MKKPRVLLADDHKIVLEGLKSVLEPQFELVGTVEDGRALVAEAARLRPDVIVADISMPGLNGIEAVRKIKENDEKIKVVFLTMHPDASYAASAFDVGASGFVLKHSAPSELITAIKEAVRGRTYVTPPDCRGPDPHLSERGFSSYSFLERTEFAPERDFTTPGRG